jgi:membrane-anchored mycosin MYCP
MPNDGNEIQIAAHDDEIIVDLNDLAGIQEVLDSSGVSWKRMEKCPRIGLALIGAGDLGKIPEWYDDPDAVSELDRLISYARRTFAEQHSGREPDIGKNRLAGSIEGSPYTGGGISGPYTGGGKAGPYTGGGKSGPYTGGGQGDPQWDDARGGFPGRSHPPNPQVKVGILDTRLFAHPDLAGRYLADHRTIVPAATVSTPASEAHATFIAGVVVARAPNADLVVGHVLNAYNICGSSWDVATKMAAFADAGVSVLNISFGAVTHDDQPPLVLRRTVQALTASGVVIVAAAGNHGPKQAKMWPAALKEVVAVGAGARVPGKKDEFEVAKFSPERDWVDLLAPGVGVRSLYKADGYASWDGTSFSSAGVSGAIAHLAETRHMTPAQAVDLLRTPPSLRGKAAADGSIDDIGPA